MKYQVAVVKTDGGIREAVHEAIQLLGGIHRFIPPGTPALLKPNLFTVKGPETGATTDLTLATAAAELLQAQGSHCTLGECPATGSYTRPDIVFDGLGARKLCKEHGIDINVLDRDPPVRIETPGVVKQELWFPKTATETMIINLPKLKTHALTTLTCAVKNLFGLQQGGIKAHHHVTLANDPEAFSHLLLDIYQAIKPQIALNIVDAHTAMEGEGPTAGDPKHLGLIIAGADATAVDTVAAALMNWNPFTDVGTIHLAAERGLGPRSLDDITVLGERIEDVKQTFRKPQIHLDGETFVRIRMPIHVDKDRCRACGVCEKVCPAKVIKVTDVPEFDMEGCIQCFCCVELCPHNALKAIRPDD